MNELLEVPQTQVQRGMSRLIDMPWEQGRTSGLSVSRGGIPAPSLLVVDRDEAPRRWMGRVLGSQGYRVLETACADEAQRLADQHRSIGLVLSEFALKGSNGLELGMWFRFSYPSTPVILMVAFSDGLDEIFMAQQAIRLLPKPFTAEELVRKVAEALGDGSR